MKRIISIILLFSTLLLLSACSDNSEYSEQCSNAVERLSSAGALHYSYSMTQISAKQTITSTWEYWVDGSDHCAYVTVSTLPDQQTIQLSKDGAFWEKQGTNGWAQRSEVSPFTFWKNQTWDSMNLKFDSAVTKAGKQYITFNSGSLLSKATWVFCFDADKKLESVEQTTALSAVLNGETVESQQIHSYIIHDFDAAVIQNTIQTAYTEAAMD